MKITFEDASWGNARTGGPVYCEPYKGFFAEKGFPPKKFGSEYCDLESSDGITMFALLGSEDPDCRPRIGPAFSSRHVIFYSVGDGNIRLGSMGCGKSTSTDDWTLSGYLKGYDAGDLTMMEQQGQDTVRAIREVNDALRQRGGAAWAGHLLSAQTAYSTQSMVLNESPDAGAKADAFVTFMERAVSDAYSGLSGWRVNRARKKMRKLYNQAGSMFAERYFAQLDNVPTECDLEETGKLSARFQEPITLWTQGYAKLRAKVGLRAADDTLYAAVEQYAEENNIPIVGSEKGDALIEATLRGHLEDVLP